MSQAIARNAHKRSAWLRAPTAAMLICVRELSALAALVVALGLGLTLLAELLSAI